MSHLLFKDGADLRMTSFSCKQSLHTLVLGANGFTFLTISHLMLTLMFLFFNFQRCSLSVVEVLLCSNLKDDLCKLNLVSNSYSVSPIYVSWLFEVVSVTVAEALKKNGYKTNLQFDRTCTDKNNEKNKTRKPKIT